MTSTPARGAADEPPAPQALSHDARLIRAVAAGDGRALYQLMDRNSAWLQARLLNRRIALELADDVLWETFIAVRIGAGTFRGTDARAWLWSVAERGLAARLRSGAGPSATGALTALPDDDEEALWYGELGGGDGAKPIRGPGR